MHEYDPSQPVTQEEWQKVMGNIPSRYSRKGARKDRVQNVTDDDLKRFPVDDVSWQECRDFFSELNRKVKEPGWIYRFPTESEWEYACRGGPLTNNEDYGFHFYLERPSNTLSPDQANVRVSGFGQPRKVGLYVPNRLGLYDMHGNVWEWCYDPSQAADRTAYWVIRGGSWWQRSEYCQASSRVIGGSPGYGNFGLRVARVAAAKE